MNIQVIAEHSVDMGLLPERANILDAGCRGFGLSDWFNLGGHNVVTIDADSLVSAKGGMNSHNHYNIALSDYTGKCYLIRSNDPQATRIEPMISEEFAHVHGSTPCYTLKDFSDIINVDFWDLIKLDIEGSEREVIMSMDRPYATQISVEFHLHTGVYDMRAVDEMVSKLKSLGYDPVIHEMTSRHGMGMNYWDSLFVLSNG